MVSNEMKLSPLRRKMHRTHWKIKIKERKKEKKEKGAIIFAIDSSNFRNNKRSTNISFAVLQWTDGSCFTVTSHFSNFIELTVSSSGAIASCFIGHCCSHYSAQRIRFFLPISILFLFFWGKAFTAGCPLVFY